MVEALNSKVVTPRAPEAPAETSDKAIADGQGLHVLDRNNDGLVDEDEFREYTSSLHMVQYGAPRVRISGVVLYNGGSAQPYTGINGDYVRSEEVCNFRAVYVKENKPYIAMWWANIMGKISWCVGPKDQVGKDGMWAHVESMGFGPEEAGTRAWTVYSYNSGSWEEQTGVEVGAGSRPSSRGDSAVGKQSRPVSGIIKVDGDGGFDSRPPSRGELRTLSRPVSGIIKVEGDGGFDSRPPSRGDARMPGAGRPLSGIIKIEGDGGFDSRPPSRGDVRPGSSRPLSGIIKMDNFNSSTLDRAGDLLPPLVDKKKRLKSASRVNFTETHVQTFSEQDTSSTLHGDLSLGQLETPAKSHAGTAGGVRLPAVERDALHREHDDPASGPSRRLGALFLGKHAFKVSDYIRASDAKEGVDSMYQPIRPDSRSGSYRSTPASSLAGSRSGTPASSRPTSGLGSRAGSSPGGSSRASSAGRRQRRGGGQRDEKYLKAKLQQQEKLAREAALREEQQKVLYETKLKLKTDSSKCIQAWCRSCLWRLCITEDFSDDPELYKFLNRRFSMLIALRIHCYFVRKKYEYDPYQSPMFLRYFSGCPRATLVANWESNVAAVRIDQRRFWDAHQCLKRALEDLHRNGMMRDMDILDLPTFHFSENDDPFGNDKTGRRENPFCAVPGCSRRPVKVCEWDGISKICDEHQFPSYWDRDTKSVTFFDKHPMNIAYPNRREFMWMNFLKGTDKRLGGGYEDEKSGKFLQCHIGDLVLPKSGVHGADKYGGNPLHFIEDILRQAWTITLPDDCRTLQEALDMAKDDSEIRFRSGYYAWKTPVEVRKRVRVTGEPGVVLHGPWTLDECAGGGRFENVTCITACGQGLHIRGGRWHFLRCTLRGYGEGVCVLSCGGETELVLEKSRVCGLNVDTGLWKPYTCLLAAGSSTVKVLGSTLQDASGYGMHVTNKAVCKIEKSEILRHYKAGLKLDQDADVLMTNSLMRDNTACFEAKGQNVPVPLAKYDPDPEVMYQEDQDCLQIFSNRIHGKLWATRQKPKLLLGKCQFKNSANKGDIIKDNAVDHNDSVAPEKPTSGTGHEAFKIAWPDNSALRVTDGSALIENYMFLRQMSGQNNPDARNPYVLEESGSWAESPDRMDYEHRPGTGMSRTSSVRLQQISG